MAFPRSWKGKERALGPRAEGSGAADGIVLPLELVGNGIYDVAYTLLAEFGSGNQQLSLQVDTGSSDLWVASTSCSSQSCSQTNGRLYNPSGSTSTGVQFSIPYLQGSASGPVVWDKVTVGGYTISYQAFGAATDVQSEPLAPNFSGILGLALPLNSIIAKSIPPVTTNDADGAAWASNLFSITPSNLAPASPFLSLSLSRPGSDKIPSLLGIGHHPSALVPDPSNVKYSTLVGDQAGVLFWKVSIRAITVYVNGSALPVSTGRAASGAAFPTAVLDSGVPLILTTSTIANGIYGAVGVSPANDGLYYVPCKTPLNLTISIDNMPDLPLHPLDLTAEPPEDNKAHFCIGLIQVADKELSRPDSMIGDMILGVPFLRNVYTVMAYAVPNSDGTFSRDLSGENSTARINPRLGLMSLTDPTQALQEFNTVRLLNQPLSSSNSTANANGANDTKTVNVGGAKLSIGVIVLLGLIAFFALCGFLFLVWWLFMRRQFHKAQSAMHGEGGEGFTDEKSVADGGMLSEDELRRIRFDAYKRKTHSRSTVSSERTRVDSLSFGKNEEYVIKDNEFGFKKSMSAEEDKNEPTTGLNWGEDTLIGSGRGRKAEADITAALTQRPPLSPERSPTPHRREPSDSDRTVILQHQPQRSVDVPLLSAQHCLQGSGAGVPNDTSLLVVQNSHGGVMESPSFVSPPLPSDRYYYPTAGEFGDIPTTTNGDLDDLAVLNGTSMAGFGTASRSTKIMMDSRVVFDHKNVMQRDSQVGFVVGVGAGGTDGDYASSSGIRPAMRR